jgi:DUF4097 and DUF4098 domain-containing protein YvlB
VKVSEDRLASFTELYIKAVEPTVTIVEADFYGLDMEYDSVIELQWEIKDQALRIIDKNIDALVIGFEVRDTPTIEGQITVYVPKDALESVVVTTVSGEIYLNGANTRGPINAKTVSGNIQINTQAADEITCNTVSGDIFIRGAIVKKITASTVSGGINASEVSVKALTAGTVSGWINVLINDRLEGYGLEISSVSVHKTLDGQNVKNTSINKNHAQNIKLTSVSGDIMLNGS